MPNDPQFNNDDGFGGLDPEQEPNQPRNSLSKSQKLAVAGLTVFAVLVVVLWFAQLKNNIYGPLNAPAASSGLASTNELDSQTAKDLALKNKDTDGDGLSDYDELNIYKTSPYLADSDSDGLLDGAEVKSGTNPNCPQGRTCLISGGNSGAAAGTSTLPAAGLGNQASPSDTLNNLLNQYGAVNSALGTGAANQPVSPSGGSSANNGAVNLNNDQIQVLKNLDAASLRQMLIEAGMDKNTLDQISDTDLMNSYQQTLNDQTGQ